LAALRLRFLHLAVRLSRRLNRPGPAHSGRKPLTFRTMWFCGPAGLLRSLMLVVLAAGCYAASAATRVETVAETLALTRFRSDSVAFATFSGANDSTHLVIRDATRWRAYWALIHAPFIPRPREPEIDFRREMVILAALGRRPSLGYDILIQSATRDSTGIEIHVRRSNPGRGCALGAAVSAPVDLARIPASRLRVRFTELITTVPCGSQ
jgi:hypothetical protein